MTKFSDGVDYSLMLVGTAIGLNDIESILGITILVIQVIWFLSKFVLNLYKAIKSKNIEAVSKTVDELKEDIDNAKDELNKKDGD